MEFRILGSLEVVDHGRTLPLGGAKQRALLAALLLSPNRAVSVDRLIDVLWPTRPPSSAANALQFHVSQLRKLLGEVIVTREPGYLIQVDDGQLDLMEFERLVAAAAGKEAERTSALLGEALELWRGEPVLELGDDAASHAEIQRLKAARLAALGQRIEADLALGRHMELVPELESLVQDHPLDERVAGALMRALYGAGRQAEALEIYRTTRQSFVAELGIEPSPTLRAIEQSILRQDPDLVPEPRSPAMRAIAVLVEDVRHLDELLSIAEPLAKRPRRELILTKLSNHDHDLATSTSTLAAQRAVLAERGVASRVAAYTTSSAGAEAALLAAEHPVDLVLAVAPSGLLGSSELSAPLLDLLDRAPCEVGLLTGGGTAADGPIVTPFGGAEHDWSAIELAAWLAAALDTSLRLLGTEADPTRGRRDASRLLARASLLVQQVVGIVTEPVLIPPGEHGVIEAATGARLLVIGLSDRWRAEGLGPTRSAIAANAASPVLFVRRGSRSLGLVPPETQTRFTWTRGP